MGGRGLEVVTAAAASMLEAIQATSAHGPGVWTDLTFDRHALELFHAQYSAVGPYRQWCDYELAETGRTIDDVRRWHEVPALPIRAFKEFRVAAQPPAMDALTWESSTTTGAVPSRHHLADGSLYEESLVAGALAALLPDAWSDERMACVQLAPSADDLPNSSLSHMCEIIRRELAEDAGVFSVDADGAWRCLGQLCEEGRPALLLATSFALVHLFDETEDRDALELPPGSRVMDTGGYKGRTRELTRDELVEQIGVRLGIPPTMCENEYGMSELSSQGYLGTIAASVGRPLPGHATPDATRWQPPWFRTRVVDPSTLEEVADGETGLLVHHDLANAWSCAVIRSEDLGIRRGASWEFAGRAPGAELRGCSLRLEDALS